METAVRAPLTGSAWMAAASAAIVCGLLHVALDWPSWIAPERVVRGWAGDNLMFCWNLWWVATAMWERGSAGLHCPIVFAPDGMAFVFHTHTWLYGLLWAGLQIPWRLVPALGAPPSPVLAYNVISLASTMLTGAAAAMLVRACGIRSPAGSILAALTVAFCGLRQVAMFGHLNFMGTEFFVASVAAHTLAMQGSGRRGWWVAGGVLAGLAFLNDQTLGIFSLYFLAAACGYAVIMRRTTGPWAALAGPALSAAAAVAVSAPHLIELARVWRSADYVVMQTDDTRASDLVNAFLPGRLSWPLGSWTGRVRMAIGVSGGDGTAYLGLHALAAWMGACCLWRSPRQWPPLARFWVAVGGTGLVLALGPALVVAGREVMPLPFALLRQVPGLDNLRVPERHNVFAVLALAVATAAVAQRFGHAALRSKVALGAVWGLLFAAGSLPRPDVFLDTTEPPVGLPPALLDHMRAGEMAADGLAVWDVPGDFAVRAALWWQVQHRRPLVFGSSARVSPALVSRLHGAFPFLKGLIPGSQPSTESALRHAGGPAALHEQVRQFVKQRRVGFVLVRKAAMPDGPDFVARYVPGAERLHEDEWFTLFHIAEPAKNQE
ncbi:MAG: hypothetical protein N2111_02280 [Candidatus Sumerlaeaceae bacterium]|nr:hypothetical protein [Candidatus Sumerlaeaceae bacterium]